VQILTTETKTHYNRRVTRHLSHIHYLNTTLGQTERPYDLHETWLQSFQCPQREKTHPVQEIDWHRYH